MSVQFHLTDQVTIPVFDQPPALPSDSCSEEFLKQNTKFNCVKSAGKIIKAGVHLLIFG